MRLDVKCHVCESHTAERIEWMWMWERRVRQRVADAATVNCNSSISFLQKCGKKYYFQHFDISDIFILKLELGCVVWWSVTQIFITNIFVSISLHTSTRVVVDTRKGKICVNNVSRFDEENEIQLTQSIHRVNVAESVCVAEHVDHVHCGVYRIARICVKTHVRTSAAFAAHHMLAAVTLLWQPDSRIAEPRVYIHAALSLPLPLSLDSFSFSYNVFTLSATTIFVEVKLLLLCMSTAPTTVFRSIREIIRSITRFPGRCMWTMAIRWTINHHQANVIPHFEMENVDQSNGTWTHWNGILHIQFVVSAVATTHR